VYVRSEEECEGRRDVKDKDRQQEPELVGENESASITKDGSLFQPIIVHIYINAIYVLAVIYLWVQAVNYQYVLNPDCVLCYPKQVEISVRFLVLTMW
jgi:hypothetical protein